MSWVRVFWTCACTALAVAASGPASGKTVDAFERGWSRESGRHDQHSPHTFTGFSVLEGERFKSFFIFDLAGVTEVSGGTLRLELEEYFGSDLSEDFTVFDVVTDVVTLNDSHRFRVAIFNDLESGSIYGSGTATPADVGSVLEIPLSAAAIEDINLALGGLFAIGVHVDTISTGLGDQPISQRFFRV